MVRPPLEFVRAAADYVCVRITDMSAIDLNRYRFDYDLTLVILLAHADGTIYHRYGGRTHDKPLAYMQMGGLVELMRRTLTEHAAYQKKPQPARRQPKHTVYDIVTFARRIARAGKRPACIHCHTIHQAMVEHAQATGHFDQAEDIWIWPAPQRVGLHLQPSEQSRVARVDEGSAAARAGLRAEDRLVRIGGQIILTVMDVQSELDRMPFAGGKLPVQFMRDGVVHRAELVLRSGWKRTDPLTWSWRPYKWPLRPAPGFGGALLSPAEKTRLGLPADRFAFRVQYIVDWGDRPEQGLENRRRGLKNGDVVISYGGRNHFRTMAHFHAFVRLTHKVGEKVTIRVIRAGAKRDIRVTLL